MLVTEIGVLRHLRQYGRRRSAPFAYPLGPSPVLRILAILLSLAGFGLAQGPGNGLVIVLIGPPGSGKTTQSELLRKKYTIPVLAGDALREKAGQSSDKLSALLRDQVLRADARKGFIIDGYPATRAEADYLGKLVKEVKLPPPIIVQLDVPDAEVRKRMRDKGDKTVLENQLALYHKELELARSYYPESDIWRIIGTRTPREVFDTIVTLIQDRE